MAYTSRRVRIYQDAIRIGLSEKKRMRPRSDDQFRLFLLIVCITTIVTPLTISSLAPSVLHSMGPFPFVALNLVAVLAFGGLVLAIITMMTGKVTVVPLPSNRYLKDEVSVYDIEQVLTEQDIDTARRLGAALADKRLDDKAHATAHRAQQLLGQENHERAQEFKRARDRETTERAKKFLAR